MSRAPFLRVVSGWPLPRWLNPLVAVVVTAMTVVATQGLLQSEYATWFAVSTGWHEALWLPGSILTGICALLGAQFSTPRSPVDPGWRPREGSWTVLAHGLALGCWAAVGHAVGMAPSVLRALSEAAWGSLAWADVLVGSVGVVTLSVVGFSIGLVLRRWIFAPLVSLLSFVILALPNDPLLRPLALITPVRHFTTMPRFELTAATSVYTMVAGAVLCVATAHLITWARSRRAAHQGAMDTVVWVGTLVALGAVGFVWRPEFYAVDRPVPVVCHAAQETTVCLHAANLPAAADADDVVAALSRAGAGPLIAAVTDRSVAEADTPTPGEVFVEFDAGPFNERMLARSTSDVVAEQISAGATVDHCEPYAPIVTIDASSALQARLLELAGYDRLAGLIGGNEDSPSRRFFGSLDQEALSAWIAANTAAINECRVDDAVPDQ